MQGMRSTLILFGLLLVLGGWYFIYEKRIRPEKEKAKEGAELLVQLPRENVSSLDIVRFQKDGKTEKLSFVQTGSDWNMTAPVQDEADSNVVGQILSELSTTKRERVVEEKTADLNAYGLKSPDITITASKAGTPPITVLIGANVHVGSGNFVQVGGQEPVIRIGPGLKTATTKDVNDYRNKKIASVLRADVSEVEITNKNGNFILQLVREKDKLDRWRLARDGSPADTSEVNNFLSTLADFKATGIAANDTKDGGKFGFGKLEIRIVVTKASDKSRVSFTLGRVKDDVYAKRDGKDVIYKVDRLVWGRLEKSAEEYQAKQIASFNRFDARRVKIERGKDSLEFVKDEQQWNFANAEGDTKANSVAVDTFLTRIQDGKIAKYTKESKKALGIETPVLAVRVYSKPENSPEKEMVSLVFGAKQGKLYPGSRGDLDLNFFISETDFASLNATKAEFAQAPKKDDTQGVPSLVPERSKAKEE